ncbi:hypothetical protein T4B_12757 [Trichinella pseudospiralis]|uniref:Uncharacterized protein n=1 Tax=Trichinella pseudospiralis TaxID=6337 RepID=A0A0V1GAN2_TRIPS|nr:hypothetical protein T4B_12757 [Trichinella pseudospiralis]
MYKNAVLLRLASFTEKSDVNEDDFKNRLKTISSP